jgi:hypothetical protein
MSSLFIYCAGGYGKEIIEVARRLNLVTPRWDAIHFLDDVCEDPVRHDAQVFRFDDACTAINRDGGKLSSPLASRPCASCSGKNLRHGACGSAP